MSDFKQLAIIGATASGKTSLAIKMAQKYNCTIFSIDSLAVYKEMDIVSAKPTLKEQAGIKHFGIDTLSVPQHFSASKVATLYQEALETTKAMNKNLIIVGGSSFYLKSLMTGLSLLPNYSQEVFDKAKQMLLDVASVYKLFQEVDPKSLENIEKNDAYRLEKLLLLYLQTNQRPSDYFLEHPAKPVIDDITIFDLQSDRQLLRERIALRTQQMLDEGLIDEIAQLELKYGRQYASMKAIGVIETLQYLDNEISMKDLEGLITTHTAQLAKRQTTFNKTQFEQTLKGDSKSLEIAIGHFFSTEV